LELLAPRPTPNLKTTPCRLSATVDSGIFAYSLISGGHRLHRRQEYANCRGKRNILKYGDNSVGRHQDVLLISTMSNTSKGKYKLSDQR